MNFRKSSEKGGVETIAIRTCDYKNQIAGRNHRIVAQWWTLCEPVTICKTERNWSEAQNLLGSKSNKWYILNGSNFDKVDYAQLCKTQIENIKLKSMYNCVRFSFKGVAFVLSYLLNDEMVVILWLYDGHKMRINRWQVAKINPDRKYIVCMLGNIILWGWEEMLPMRDDERTTNKNWR